MRPRSWRPRATRRGRSSAQRGSLRILFLLLCAAGVIAGMVVLADRASQQADLARRAQVLMERVRSETQQSDVVAWRALATATTGSTATAGKGFDDYKQVVATLRELRRLGVDNPRIAQIERDVGNAYAISINAMVVSRADPRAGRRMALSTFSPATTRLDAVIASAIRTQERSAQAALLRARIVSLASLVVGVLLLLLLGWRVSRVQGRFALAEQTRAAERRGEERLHALMRHSSDVVAVIDPNSHVRWLAESVRGMLGYEPETLVHRRLDEFVHPGDDGLLAPFLLDTDRQEGMLSLRVRAADGEYRHLELVADNRMSDPLIQGILINMRDVSERVTLLERLRHQAFHDSLTGLPNRLLFDERLSRALLRLQRGSGSAAVMFIDFDDFKAVNDGLGHAAGDELLQAVAQRLESMLRGQDTCARLGGDEFAVLLEEVADEAEALSIAERLRVALEPALSIGGRQIAPTASIGVACRQAGDTAEGLLGNADVAMYAAKERGKGQVVLFEPQMRLQAVERAELTAELGTALQRDELVLDYQPLIALGDGTITGFEALLRWQHPTRGRLGPDRFIALAEAAGLIVGIGAWVLRTACAQLSAWQTELSWPGELNISVNISAHQLSDGGLASEVRAALADTGISARQLTLEITEGLLVEDRERIQSQLRELKEIGVRLAVDDFGTGYSALSYLRSFPLDILKIDRSFVTGIDLDPERARLVRGIIDMAHSLALVVVTEGIEEPGEAALVTELKSDYGQGYWFSRPVDADAVAQLLASQSPAPIRHAA